MPPAAGRDTAAATECRPGAGSAHPDRSPRRPATAGPGAACPKHVETGVGRDPVQPGAKRAGATVTEARAPAPGAQEGLLDDVLGVLERAQHPVAVDLKLAPVAVERRGERGLVARRGAVVAWAHRRMMTADRSVTDRRPARPVRGWLAGVVGRRPALEHRRARLLERAPLDELNREPVADPDRAAEAHVHLHPAVDPPRAEADPGDRAVALVGHPLDLDRERLPRLTQLTPEPARPLGPRYSADRSGKTPEVWTWMSGSRRASQASQSSQFQASYPASSSSEFVGMLCRIPDAGVGVCRAG